MNLIVQKPWGSYEVIEKGKNYLIKKIIVVPEAKLSLQSHQYRSEHWVIIEGIAKVTIDDVVKELKQNESIFVPKKSKHRIENNNTKNLVIIEVQYGNILKEEDIIRYKDIYNRN
tara:strand:+ start:887 stop:1231 length:345 start_codon:yes stop_codon:yes gene_type:complete